MFSEFRQHLIGSAFLLTAVLIPQSVDSGERVPSPEIKIPSEAEACIRPTEFMRKNHMNLLTHKRDETVHNGIRTPDASLEGCISCHTNKADDGTAIPVNAPGQFCSSCHEYAAVKLDCFECHRTTPEEIIKTGKLPGSPFDHVASVQQTDALNNLQKYIDEAQQ